MRAIVFTSFLLLCFSLLMQAQVNPVYSDPFNLISTNDEGVSDAMTLIKYGDFDGAIQLLKKLRRTDSRSYEVYYLLGLANKMKGEISEAIDNFTSATHEDAFYIPAFFERANCHLIKENYKQAVFDYDRVLLIDSTFVPAYNNRAYARIRNYGEQNNPVYQLRFAKQDLLKAMQISSARGEDKRFETYFNIGLIELYQSEYALAAASFDTAITVKNDIAKAYYFRGAALFLNRDYEVSAQDFEQAEALGFEHPNTPEFLRIIDLVEKHKANLKLQHE
jgi:tetratricopeptide (TPR) repeat protein